LPRDQVVLVWAQRGQAPSTIGGGLGGGVGSGGGASYTRRLKNATPVTLASETHYYAEMWDDLFFAIYSLSFGLDIICTQSIREL